MSAGAGKTVLVSGGSGFLGGWCVRMLLERGYQVRATVRDPAREDEVRAATTPPGVDPGHLAVHVAELGSEDGWAAAVEGCEYALHVASPFPSVQPKDPDEVIVPAREGTLRLLRAALAAGVERIVVTSSTAAIGASAPADLDRALDESDWTDPDRPGLTPYARSKTLAERAAWAEVEGADRTDRLATVNPGAILGPPLGAADSFSLEMVQRLLGGTPGIPRIGFSVVDVRDVADLHIRAMETPRAGGERFLAATEFLWMHEVAAILREQLDPEDARRVPTRRLPDFLVRAMGVFDPSIRSVARQLGRRVTYSSRRAIVELEWSPRPVAETVADCARALLAR